MNDLMATLGLDAVDSDPNKVAPNTYDAVVVDVDCVLTHQKTQVAHVITYKIESGDHAGARIPHFFNLGKDPVVDEAGNIKGYTPTMTDGNKKWYKKAFVDLGIPEAQVSSHDPKSNIGKKVTIGVKHTTSEKGVFQNVSFVRLRDGSSNNVSAPADLSQNSEFQPTPSQEVVTGSGNIASEL